MSRPLTLADLQTADIYCQRAAMLPTLNPYDPARVVCEGILAGEALMTPNPQYFHVGMVVGPADDVIEELPQGQTEDHENLLSAWYDIYRLDLTPEQRAAVVASMRSRLGQRYGYEDYAFIGGIRVLHLPLAHPAYKDPKVCSSSVGASLAENNIFPWKSRGLDVDLLVPADYPGDGMRIVSAAGQYVEAAAA